MVVLVWSNLCCILFCSERNKVCCRLCRLSWWSSVCEHHVCVFLVSFCPAAFSVWPISRCNFDRLPLMMRETAGTLETQSWMVIRLSRLFLSDVTIGKESSVPYEDKRQAEFSDEISDAKTKTRFAPTGWVTCWAMLQLGSLPKWNPLLVSDHKAKYLELLFYILERQRVAGNKKRLNCEDETSPAILWAPDNNSYIIACK